MKKRIGKKCIKTKDTIRKNYYLQLVLIIVLALALELIIANFGGIAFALSGAEYKNLYTAGTGNEGIIINSDNSVNFRIPAAEFKTVGLTFAGDDIYYKKVTVAFTDENFLLEGGYEYNCATDLMVIGGDRENVINLSSYGDAQSISVSCEDEIELTGLSINVKPPMDFSPLRFLFIWALIVCVAYGIWREPIKGKGYLSLAVCAVVVCLLIVFVTGLISYVYSEPLLTELPDDVTEADEYTQLYDAFSHGRLDLDIKYDEEKLYILQNLSNPYDRSMRNEWHLHGAIWDRAYYNGKFYSYFGAAPVILIYFPISFVTGMVPTTLLVSAILCIVNVVFMSLLYGLFLRKFCREVPIVLAVLGQLALLFGSVVFASAAELAFYYVAVIGGTAWTAAFLYFLFSAYFCKIIKKRVVLLVFAGVSVVLIAASRPTMLLYCFIGLIPAVHIFTDKKEKLKSKIFYGVAVGVPVVIGAVLIMTYNYMRFENPLEFGFNYQITVSRAQANTIKLSMILPTLYHYFIQQPSADSSFPYMYMRMAVFDSYTRYSYNGNMMGVLSYPAAWGVFLLPFVLKNIKKIKTQILIALPVSAVLMAFIDMCKAGSHYRYTTDIAFIIILASLVAIFDAVLIIKERAPKRFGMGVAAAAAALVFTIILGGLTFFANESANMIWTYPAVTDLMRQMF